MSTAQTTSTGTFLKFLSPWLVGTSVLVLLPVIASLVLSFTSWDGLSIHDIHWVGSANYRQIFEVDSSREVGPNDPWYWRLLGGIPKDAQFYKSVYNTTIFAVFAVPLGLAAALGLALLLNQPLRGISAFRTIYYLPYILSGVGTILLWQWLFNPDVGLINLFLKYLVTLWTWTSGLFGHQTSPWSPPAWLYSPQGCKPAVILMNLWGMGGAMLIFLAALQNVPPHLYAAAQLDGANRRQKFRCITLPQISPAILFNLIAGLSGAVRSFKIPYVLQHWSQNDGLLFYMLYVYRSAFESPARIGYASALIWILFVVLFVLTALTLLTSRRWVHYEVR